MCLVDMTLNGYWLLQKNTPLRVFISTVRWALHPVIGLLAKYRVGMQRHTEAWMESEAEPRAVCLKAKNTKDSRGHRNPGECAGRNSHSISGKETTLLAL